MKHLPLILLALIIGPLSAQAETDVQTVNIRDNIHMLINPNGGNVTAFTGEDGTFIIDDNLEGREQIITDAIKAIKNEDIKFVLNTHYHFDHTGTNKHFGDQHAIIVAHDNVRKRLSEEQFISFFKKKMEPMPASGLPVVTFSDAVTLHYNGDDIKIIYLPGAHTDGDAAAHFINENVIVAGDIIFNGMYPFIDAEHGGSIKGLLAAQETLITLANDDTTIIPGHGPAMNKTELQTYHDTLANIVQTIETAIKEGKTKDETIAAKPTEGLLKEGPVNADAFVGFLYGHLGK